MESQVPAVGQTQELREIVILGSTGSIGTQALNIVRRNRGRFRVVALAAGGAHPDVLARQAAEFGVAAVAVPSPAAAAEVQDALRLFCPERTRPLAPRTRPRPAVPPVHRLVPSLTRPRPDFARPGYQPRDPSSTLRA